MMGMLSLNSDQNPSSKSSLGMTSIPQALAYIIDPVLFYLRFIALSSYYLSHLGLVLYHCFQHIVSS
jgi:hypothetical protein